MGYFDFDFPHTHFYNSDLREILKYVRNLVKAVTKIDGWIESHEKEYEEIKKLYEDMLNGKFTPEMLEALQNWTKKYTIEIIGSAIGAIFFELTDDGYFKATIPDSWNDLQFSTSGLDNFTTGADYGHLIFTY